MLSDAPQINPKQGDTMETYLERAQCPFCAKPSTIVHITLGILLKDLDSLDHFTSRSVDREFNEVGVLGILQPAKAPALSRHLCVE